MIYVLTIHAGLSADPVARLLDEVLGDPSLPPEVEDASLWPTLEWQPTGGMGLGWTDYGLSGGSPSGLGGGIGGLGSLPPRQMKVSVLGPLAQEAAEEAVRAIEPSLAGCYREALRAHPVLMGEVTLRVEVRGDGAVEAAGLKSAGALSEALAPCVAEAAAGLVLPPLEGGERAVIVLPVQFSLR